MKNLKNEPQPSIHTVTRRLAERLTGFYTLEEMMAFFSVEMHPAIRRAFYIMLHTGIQACELVQVKPGDYTVEGDSIIVRSDISVCKLPYEMMQEYPLNEKLMNTILECYYHRPSMNHLFSDDADKPLKIRTLAMECRRIGAYAGIQKPMRLQYFVNTFYRFIRYREAQNPFLQLGSSLASIPAPAGQ